ncbi:hypothetical protein THARTR1_11016 [Trichoderma harzianum]|uniref:AAA+ ATPase lid domain-containing protein n=1 Tax=Trichoderma harzianum TaxID=5544 RepID=A0A2K0TGI5_TRIHA|nr:hypothetical protein THARTR1_11016 [Trichoderma harzianum]
MSVRFNRKEIEEYARKHWKSTSKGTRWNGRQIKNAFQTAIALADWDHVESTGGNLHPDGPLLKVEHFKKVAQASAHFDNYLIKVRKTDEQRAREHDIRRDDVGFDPDEEPTKRAPGKTKLLKSKSGRTATTSSEPSEDGSEEETEDEDASDFQSDSVEEEEKEITRSPSPPPKKKNSKKKRERE